MTIPDRSKRFDLAEGSEPVARPKIWVDGHQRPKFDLTAYATTSLGIAKRDLAPEILDAAARLQGLGDRVLAGEMRVNVAWAGRAAKVVPSCARVGGWILILRGLMLGAHELLVPPEQPEEPLAYAHLIARAPLAVVPPSPSPAPVPMPAAAPKPVEPTLHAIRSVLQSAPHSSDGDLVTPRRPARPTQHPDAPKAMPPRPPSRAVRMLHRGTSAAMLGVMMAFALPGGAIKALIFHLDGGDLRDWS